MNLSQALNIVYDTNYTSMIPQGGYPYFDIQSLQTEKQPSWLDKIMAMIFGKASTTKPSTSGEKKEEIKPDQKLVNKTLKEQIKYIIELPDEQYNDKLLTNELRKFITETEQDYLSSLADYKSHIAPSYREFKSNQFNVSGITGKSYYTQSYPSYIDALWTRVILNFHGKWDMSFYIYPEDDAAMQGVLKQKATQLKAEINDANSKGMTLDMEIEVQYKDIDMIRQKLTTREERYFETGFYTNLYHHDPEKLNEEGKKFEQKVSGFGIKIKNATQRMDEGFNSNLPLCSDDLGITRSTITSSLAGSFPFISSDMITNTGILYGINLHTGALVVFDRFNGKLPNMNSVILATSGAGKSFAVKLEILRYLLNGIQIMVIDPENEYKSLIDKVGGTYVNIATNSNQFINPFDIPPKIEDIDYGKGDLLRSQIMTLNGFIALLIGGTTAEEEALLDKALQATYSLKGITLEDDNYEGRTPPIMGDLLNVLEGMDGGDKIAIRLSKYVTGTFGKLFNNYTNIDVTSQFSVFSIRDLEDALKTPAMYNVMNYIWNKVRAKKTKRLLVVDEAWIMLKTDTSASFLFGLIKRGRKYGLGITTITQDIEDFMRSQYGKPIVSNSSVQLLLKQSTTSIKSLNEILGLTEAEKQRLVSGGIGEGLMFAGNQHIALKVLASPAETAFITTDVAQTP